MSMFYSLNWPFTRLSDEIVEISIDLLVIPSTNDFYSNVVYIYFSSIVQQSMTAASLWQPQLSRNAFVHMATGLGTSQWLSHLYRDTDCPWNGLLFGAFCSYAVWFHRYLIQLSLEPLKSVALAETYLKQWCGLRPSVLGQDWSQTKKIGIGLGLARCGLGS